MIPSPERTAAPPPALPSDRGHLNFLDGLRALAALFVLLHHTYLQVWDIFRHQHPSRLFAALSGWMLYGHLAVSLFIVLSGFCLMLPLSRGDGRLRDGALGFYRRRAWRILPPYYLALLLSLIVQCANGAPFSPRALVTHLLLIHNLWPETIGSLNGALWSIAVECQIYLLFPLIVWAWRRWGGQWTLPFTLAAAYGLHALIGDGPLRGLTPHYLALFALGMLGSELAFSQRPIWSGWRERVSWRRLSPALLLLLVGWCVYWGWEEALGPRQAQTDLLAGLAAAALLVAASRPGVNRISSLLSQRPLVVIGGFAYSLYLIHLPLLGLCRRLIVRLPDASPEAAFALLLLGCGPLIVGAAYLFFPDCERPFLNSRRRPR